jgi:RNA polymerase sigma factor FliA
VATQPTASETLRPALASRPRAVWPGRARRPRTSSSARRAALAADRAPQREQLIVELLALVRRVALEMRERLPAHVDVEDLMSAGTLGLMDAVRRFDSGKQVKIETYARYRIRGAILDALRGLDPASRDMRKKNKRAERAFHELEAKLGRPATDAEMAEALHISLKDWYKNVQEMQSMGVDWLRPMQMCETRRPDEEELAATNPQDQFDLCYRQEQRQLLNRALERVSERERLLLSLYYEQDLTMKQIGEHLGIDESRVSQIHSTLVARLRIKVQTLLHPPSPVSSSVTAFAART